MQQKSLLFFLSLLILAGIMAYRNPVQKQLRVYSTNITLHTTVRAIPKDTIKTGAD